MWEFANRESVVAPGKLLSHLDKVRVCAVLKQVEDVLPWGPTVWAGVGVGVPSFRSVELSPEGT